MVPTTRIAKLKYNVLGQGFLVIYSEIYTANMNDTLSYVFC